MDRKKIFAVAAAIFLVISCCLMMILYPALKGEDIFNPEPTPEQVGQQFFTALKNENYAAAFALCDDFLQAELIDPSNLQYIIEFYEYQPEDWEFLEPRVSTNQVELAGVMRFKLHNDGTFQLILRRDEDGWKVSVFHLDYN